MKPLLITGLAALLLACGSEASSAATLPAKLVYSRDGGFVGVSEKATVRPAGRATVSGGSKGERTVRLAGWERDRIARYVRQADLMHIKSGKSECCDQYDYRIAYRGRKLLWSGGNLPAKVSDLIDALNRVVEKYGGGLGR